MRRASRKPPRLELVTRDGCHLCDEMKAVLDQVLPQMQMTYRTVNVDSEPELADRFGTSVPVLLRDGKPVAKFRLDARRLRRIVSRRRSWLWQG